MSTRVSALLGEPAVAPFLGASRALRLALDCGCISGLERKILALAEEGDRVFVDDLADDALWMPSAAHLHDEVRQRGRLARPPIASRVDQQPLRTIHLDDVAGTLRRALGRGIER